MDSILNSIKKLIGISEAETSFDDTIIVFINYAFSILYQLGIGKPNFSITDSSTTWDDYSNSNPDIDVYAVRTYVYLRVKMSFDPPANSVLTDTIQKSISELEWRLTLESDFNSKKGGA